MRNKRPPIAYTFTAEDKGKLKYLIVVSVKKK